jgi:RND family efflux transporter MFP subunit
VPPSAAHRARTWLTIGILSLSLAACRRSSDSTETGASTLGVTVHSAKRENLRDVARASGTVVPAIAGDWTIYAPDVAEIADLPKAEGEAVKSGDVLVRFNIASRTQELAALELEVIAAEQALERSAADLKRQTDFFDRGLVSRSAFEASRAVHSSSENNVAQARSRLEMARAGQDLSVVRARFAGTVAKVWRAKGDTVTGGPTDPVLRVIDPLRVQISIQLPVAQLVRVVPGQQAIVRPIAGATDEPATVVFKAETFDPGAATGEVRLTLQNPVVLPLESPVSVELLLDVRSAAIAVPSVAVKSSELGPYVMVVGDDGLVHRREIRAGLVAGELTQVLTGVEEGDRVVTSGLTDESANLPVSVVQ